MPTDRMGPPPGASPPMRMTASWSGSNQILPHTSLRHEDAPHGELPSDPQQTDGRPPAKPPFAVHHRSANLIAGDATKNGFRSEQRTGKNQNDYLTGKAPYRLESISLQR